MNRLTLLLLLSFTSSFAQQKSFSNYTFSFGYGFYNLERQIVKNNIEENYSVKEGYIFNRRQTQIGPIYLKAETNLSKNVGLSLCLNYNQFSFFGDYYVYKNGGIISAGGPGSNAGGPNSSIVTEKLKYSSLAIAIRSNFYLYNKSKFKLYLGLGLGYRQDKTIHESNFKELIGSDYNIYFFQESYHGSPLAGELTFGIRGDVWKDFGLYVEVGIAKSLLQTGVFYVFNRPSGEVEK